MSVFKHALVQTTHSNNKTWQTVKKAKPKEIRSKKPPPWSEPQTQPGKLDFFIHFLFGKSISINPNFLGEI